MLVKSGESLVTRNLTLVQETEGTQIAGNELADLSSVDLRVLLASECQIGLSGAECRRHPRTLLFQNIW